MQELFEIERIEVNKEIVKNFKERDFFGLAFDLLKEVGIHSSLVSTLYPEGQSGWDKYQAIVGGHLIRSNKLIIAVLDQAAKNRMEIVHIFLRLIYECTINARFLMKKNSKEVFESYIKYTLRDDKRLYERIYKDKENEKRELRPIDKRMIKSIERYYKIAGYELKDIDSSNKRNWGGSNVYKRAEELNMKEAHQLLFSGQSFVIHGNWHDLLLYHLEETDDGYFKPAQDWSSPKTSIVNSISFFTVPLLKDFINYLHGDVYEKTEKLYNEIFDRVVALEYLHEEYLQNR